ncbi:uncharacterized protein [Dermacentor andersoni]|uniref:uncharacterized protein n=1 Tax=Dermacentor andersoni TaxID=34620 RepID=UPI0024178C2F|nr:uncharacterized protein LOC126539019 [Dermacentor andersoni]
MELRPGWTLRSPIFRLIGHRTAERPTSLRSRFVGSRLPSVGFAVTQLHDEYCEKPQRDWWNLESRVVVADNVTTHDEVDTWVIVLVWSPVHGSWPQQFITAPMERVPMEGCKVHCLPTRDGFLLISAGAVVFHDWDLDVDDFARCTKTSSCGVPATDPIALSGTRRGAPHLAHNIRHTCGRGRHGAFHCAQMMPDGQY